MNLRRLSLPLLITLCLSFSCSCNRAGGNPDEGHSPMPSALNEQSNEFAFRLYSQADRPGKNLFYSPYSISSALSMVYGGAKGNTAAQIAEAMVFKLPEDQQHAAFKALQEGLNELGKRKKAELNVANALFGAQRYEHLLVQDYLKLLNDYYYSDLYSLDFGKAQETTDFINNWVEKKTKDRIKNLISKDHIEASNDGLVLVNAIYFKGNWKNQFDPKQTLPDDFYTSSTQRTIQNRKPVQMMSLQGKFPYAELPGYQILELPYAEEELAMLFVLPDEIDDLKDNLNAENFAFWQSELNTREVKVYIPRFKFDLTLDGLTGMLKNMGMKDAFNADLADFSGIRKEEGGAGLYILDIIHKAFVEVNEEGTEAAAATGVVMATKSAPSDIAPIPVFRADRPFLYLILHKPSNTVLFLGKLNDPPKL